ncbi:MAG TPA: SRPBCC family protein [Acidimicrobiales bacterium]|jgi:carbon monoxide dehydrogenase subunit G|nr:SRPBCC family protein [Acidimicrobiales bacterium]
MSADQVEIEIAATPAAVWAVVGDFGAVGEMLPDLESFRLEGDDRVLGMFGMEIRERLISRDDDGRALTYSIVGGVPIESHRATVSVAPAGAGSKVTWAFDVTPDEMARILADTYGQALGVLATKFS